LIIVEKGSVLPGEHQL